jgi:hypothetical protein
MYNVFGLWLQNTKWGSHCENCILVGTRYDYNLTIMKSPKPATYQILMILDNVEFLPPIFMPCFGSHFENGRHLENFENAELLF